MQRPKPTTQTASSNKQTNLNTRGTRSQNLARKGAISKKTPSSFPDQQGHEVTAEAGVRLPRRISAPSINCREASTRSTATNPMLTAMRTRHRPHNAARNPWRAGPPVASPYHSLHTNVARPAPNSNHLQTHSLSPNPHRPNLHHSLSHQTRQYLDARPNRNNRTTNSQHLYCQARSKPHPAAKASQWSLSRCKKNEKLALQRNTSSGRRSKRGGSASEPLELLVYP